MCSLPIQNRFELCIYPPWIQKSFNFRKNLYIFVPIKLNSGTRTLGFMVSGLYTYTRTDRKYCL